ncbi:MAG: sigma-70 family RNA polymerase sigma factor [Amnibacterium sp.]
MASEIANPEDQMLDTERTRYVAAAVTALPERMRYIVEQIYYHDRSVNDLAEELGLTHSAVSQQRSEAVRLMRDGLQEHYTDGASAEPHSRVAPARRAAYLARLAETATAGMNPGVPARIDVSRAVS